MVMVMYDACHIVLGLHKADTYASLSVFIPRHIRSLSFTSCTGVGAESTSIPPSLVTYSVYALLVEKSVCLRSH